MRIHKPILLVGIFAVLLAACLGNDAEANDPDINDQPSAVVDWKDPSKVTDLGDGWTIQACEGDGPFLCVERDGVNVGTLEGIAFPVASFDALDPDGDVAANLATFANDFHESLEADRTATCGDGYVFDRLGPETFGMGGTPGIFYGYRGTMADGSPAELNLQYATIAGDQIVAITAIAYDEGQCPGRDDTSSWDSETLSEFRSRLERVIQESPLPDLT